MYGPIRDIFINLLDYPARDVDIDTTGEGGRPDVTVRVPTGPLDAEGNKTAQTSWIVVEAKDEPGSFSDSEARERIFSQKAKYIGSDTAWFVMVEPDLWVLRPAGAGQGRADTLVPLDLLPADITGRLALLHVSQSGVLPQLERFRQGDCSIIATEALSAPNAVPLGHKDQARLNLNRKRFFADVRSATADLQRMVAVSLQTIRPDIDEYVGLAQEFWAEFPQNGDAFDPHTLTLRGRAQGAEEFRRRDRRRSHLRQRFARKPSIARLALYGLPAFQRRTGASKETLDDLFSVETANLILARVLLLRFFEDHGFFGPVRYVCNGGVEAFQHMRTYFKKSYADLLRDAYQEGGHFYAAAFDQTEMDWIFGLKDEALSRTIEWTLFRFARYNFTTIKGDILTGIYDRFLDRNQRKRFGEFYTPPSIARYIVQRIGIDRDSVVLDPACGSGTFLIEAYRRMVGQDAESGTTEYADVLSALQRIRGNDLNTFSAVLTQIQVLWQVLGFKHDIQRAGEFPDLPVTANTNSLVQRNIVGDAERFSVLDVREYDAVVGNPPYVRAERSDQALSEDTLHYFHGGGVSGKLNTYALFLYKALDRWCKPADASGMAGKVGFVVPVSLFDSNDTAALRKLFAVGGRWTIREIADMEAIYRDVFDAYVYPAIILAENRPAREDDVVSIRFADASCVRRGEPGTTPEFMLDDLPESRIRYRDMFAPDGRILTRLTERRHRILRKLWSNDTWVDAAKRIWVLKKGAKIVRWTDKQAGTDGRWEQKRLCIRGLVFRHQKAQTTAGIDVFKGENIVATEVQGEPVLASVDLSGVDDPGPWRYIDLLPKRAYAVAQVAHCPNATSFDPHRMAFTDTATLFFPREDLSEVPFDLLLLSNVYVWFYALAARMGIIRSFFSHIYPTNFKQLPWSEALAPRAKAIEDMRVEIVSACRNVTAAEQALIAELSALDLTSLKVAVRAARARLIWSDFFDDSEYECSIYAADRGRTDDGPRIGLSDGLLDWVVCSDAAIAKGLLLALGPCRGQTMTRSQLLNMPIPVCTTDAARWQEIVAQHNPRTAEERMQQVVYRLDAIVGAALGLPPDDIVEIQRDMRDDPFLQEIRPRYPGTLTRKQGFRTGLDSTARYE